MPEPGSLARPFYDRVIDRFYALEKEDRPRDWHPEDVGGVDPDLGYLAGVLRCHAREAFDINEVPEEVVRLLAEVEPLLDAASAKVYELLLALLPEPAVEEPGPEPLPEPEPPKPAGDVMTGQCPECNAPIRGTGANRSCAHQPGCTSLALAEP